MDKRWQIIVIQTSDGKLHEIWQWEYERYIKYGRRVENEHTERTIY